MEFYLEGLLHEIGLIYIIKCNSLHEGTNVEKNKRIKTKVEMRKFGLSTELIM